MMPATLLSRQRYLGRDLRPGGEEWGRTGPSGRVGRCRAAWRSTMLRVLFGGVSAWGVWTTIWCSKVQREAQNPDSRLGGRYCYDNYRRHFTFRSSSSSHSDSILHGCARYLISSSCEILCVIYSQGPRASLPAIRVTILSLNSHSATLKFLSSA
jgi:hypothetical protein